MDDRCAFPSLQDQNGSNLCWEGEPGGIGGVVARKEKKNEDPASEAKRGYKWCTKRLGVSGNVIIVVPSRHHQSGSGEKHVGRTSVVIFGTSTIATATISSFLLSLGGLVVGSLSNTELRSVSEGCL